MSIYTRQDLTAGMQQIFSKVITEGEAALYAGLIGDSWQKARALQPGENDAPPRLPVHHLLLVGMIGGLLNTRIPSAGLQMITMQYEFLSPVYCGDRVETIIELAEFDPHKRLATFKTDCYNQNKTQVITGQAVMLVPNEAH